MRLPIRRRGYESWDRCQASRRVRSQLQVNQGGLDSSVAQPPAQVVQRGSVEQHMPGKTMPQRVGPNTSTLWDSDSLSGPKDRLLYPLPDRYLGHIDQPALPNGPEAGGGGHVSAICSSGWTVTTRALCPLPCRTTRVGRSESRCRSRASRARASDTRRSARPLFQHDQPGFWVGGGRR